jgi:hypothetical protein
VPGKIDIAIAKAKTSLPISHLQKLAKRSATVPGKAKENLSWIKFGRALMALLCQKPT